MTGKCVDDGSKQCGGVREPGGSSMGARGPQSMCSTPPNRFGTVNGTAILPQLTANFSEEDLIHLEHQVLEILRSVTMTRHYNEYWNDIPTTHVVSC